MTTAPLESLDWHTTRQHQKLSPVIRQRLIDFRSRFRQRKLWQLVTLGIVILLTGFLIQFASDRLVETPKAFRAATLLSALGALSLACWTIGYRGFWNTRRLAQVARGLRDTFPLLSDQLLSVVELAESAGEQQRSPQLVAAAMAQVEKKLVTVNLREALPRSVARPLMFVALSQWVLVAALFGFIPGAARNALARVTNPWSTIERFTFARIVSLEARSVQALGEPFAIQVTLQAESDWKPTVATCRIDRRAFQAKLDSETNGYVFQLPGLTQESPVQFTIGDCTARTTIVPLNRPDFLDLSAEVKLPSYLKYPQTICSDGRSGTVHLLPGSMLRLSGRANRELSEVKLAQSSASGPASTETRLSIDSDRFQSESWQVNAAEQLHLTLRDVSGLASSAGHQLKIRMTQDRLPEIQCQGLSQVANWLASDTLKFDVKAEDDYGIARLGLQWQVLEPEDGQAPPEELLGERIISDGNPEKKTLSALATFNCVTEKLKPQTLQLRVFAEDYRGIDGRVYSVPYVIRFMSAAEHANWIGKQLQRWKGKLDSAHDHEMQLLDENRNLRQSMLSGDADWPAVQQKLQQQASSERSNADKLEKSIEEGRSLLEQALRNEAFRSQQIEAWASALERLDQIAQSSMPSVAQKLDQASRAGSKASSEEATATNPSPADKPDSSAESERLLMQSIEDQMRLVDDLRRSKEAFSELSSELENSSFVKRFKAAAQFERQLASLAHGLIGSAFGRPAKAVSPSDHEGIHALNSPLQQAAENLERIQRDLDAYQQDNPDTARAEVLNEMKTLDALTKLKELPLRMARNLRGDTLNRLEFWADTLDRWGEELAGPSKSGGSSNAEEKPKDRLPAAIQLEILRTIYDQTDLRDETRTLAQLAPEGDAAKQNYQERLTAQAVQQMSIQQRTLNTISDIRAIPSGTETFDEELKKLNEALQHMDDASGRLIEGTATDNVLSAQTAAIEALIDSRRNGGKGKGDGGGGGGGSMSGGSTSRQPLDLLGPASDKAANDRPRQSGEGTGKTGRVLPEEYREGLDSFLNEVNRSRGQP